jgi:hypothetical protein
MRAVEEPRLADFESELMSFPNGRYGDQVDQHELQQLSTLWERAKAGKGQVVLISGEAGIGKSRLCETWLDRIANEPHIIIRNQCSPHHTNTAFYPIIHQLKHVAQARRHTGYQAQKAGNCVLSGRRSSFGGYAVFCYAIVNPRLTGCTHQQL